MRFFKPHFSEVDVRFPYVSLLCCALTTGCLGSPDVVAKPGPPFELPADRRIEWAGHTGVPGGIPTRSQICADVTQQPYGARGDGVADDAPAIQAALNACPENQVVFLPAGTYRLGAGLLMRRNGLVLRGAGADKTTLRMEANNNLIGVYPDRFDAIGWLGGYDKGATAISLERTDLLTVGQELLLDQLDDPAWVRTNAQTPPSCTRNGSLPFGGNARNALQIVRITAIEGNTVRIEPALHHSHGAQWAPQAFAWSSASYKGNLQALGVENLKVVGGGASGYLLDFWFCSFCWVRNVEVENPGPAAVTFRYAFQGEVRDSYFHDSRAPLVGERYGVRLETSSGMLVENNVFLRMVSPVAFPCANSGAVVAYNYAADLWPGASFLVPFAITLGGENALHLFEGNVGPAISVGGSTGSANGATVFRNQLTGLEPNKTTETYALGINAWARGANVIGNVLGTAGYHDRYQATPADAPVSGHPVFVLGFSDRDVGNTQGADSQVAATLLRHGNVDLVSGGATWTKGWPHRLPKSLYLSAAPAFWLDAPWPPFGPDVSNSEIPAQVRARSLSP